jgi:UrcA family protein
MDAMHKIIVSTLAAVSFGLAVTPAVAETVKTTVLYDDLDLSTASGMATLEGRVQGAAKRICGRAELRDIKDVSDRRRCLREAMDDAGQQIVRIAGAYRELALNVNSHR